MVPLSLSLAGIQNCVICQIYFHHFASDKWNNRHLRINKLSLSVWQYTLWNMTWPQFDRPLELDVVGHTLFIHKHSVYEYMNTNPQSLLFRGEETGKWQTASWKCVGQWRSWMRQQWLDKSAAAAMLREIMPIAYIDIIIQALLNTYDQTLCGQNWRLV